MGTNKVELRAEGKTYKEAFSKLVKAMNNYITHKFNTDEIIRINDHDKVTLTIKGEKL